MQKARSWQDSFDRLEAARRDERQMHDAEEQQIRDAEAAYARAVAIEAEKPAAPGFMLARENTAYGEVQAKPKRQAKPDVKTDRVKTAPRKRAATRRTTAKTKAPLSKPLAATKPRAAKPRKSAPRTKPASVASPPIMEMPAAPAEQLLITPLPRSASLAPYRKTGLFGLIGSWLHIATRQAASGLAGSVRRPKMKVNLRKSGRKSVGQIRTPLDEIAELKAENARLRCQLEAMLAPKEGAVS